MKLQKGKNLHYTQRYRMLCSLAPPHVRAKSEVISTKEDFIRAYINIKVLRTHHIHTYKQKKYKYACRH